MVKSNKLVVKCSESLDHKGESSGHKVRKKDCVWPKRIQNVEADYDVIEVVGVPSGSEVVSVPQLSESSP